MRCLAILAFWVGASVIHGQTKPEIDLEEFAERLFQLQDQDTDYEDIYESLLLFYTEPLNLNHATAAQLSSLFLLSPVQVESLIHYREEQGELLSIYELQAIDNFGLETIEQLLPFVTVEEKETMPKSLFHRISEEQNRYLLLRQTRILQQQRGYDQSENNGYVGSQDKIYGRFRVNRRNDFSLGLTFEKDAGEPFERQGFDYYSYHFMLEKQGPFSRILVGDFQMEVGQGLVFGSGFNPGKGAETVNTVKRNTLGIRPYTSVLETGFFRGAAASVPVGPLEVTLFYSRLNQDGTVRADSVGGLARRYVSTVQTSGLHRTPHERMAKNQLQEQAYGGMLVFRPNRAIQLGLTGLINDFSLPLKRSDALYNLYEFSGRQNKVYSGFGSIQWRNLHLFGELARSYSGGHGAIGGVIASLSNSIDLAVTVRDYAVDFHTFYGNAFGEGSRTINERGVYWGFKYRPSRKYTFTAYYDKFSFPWLRFRVDAPSAGSEWLGRFTWKPKRNITAFVQLREETKGVSIAEENLARLVDRVRRNHILQVDYRLNSSFSFKTRLQTSTQDKDGLFTRGYALIQDLGYSFGRFRLSGRIAIFDTDDYDNRQYVYERDVLYAFSIPAYSGEGVRNYLLLRYKPARNLDLWLRYASFSYRDRESVGSGLDESAGPFRSEIKCMMRWAW